ncbi:unnamed protein product [Eruca vesicaria subsp. sativa]|uniref:Uncharacterized protein n=1 Tax=Eruca vesicaria subsp. sativa TaxID=29727 RepID=A0ABC8JBQ3_ERUVS|nr:unnamed protein product [Eruca vesicaria subsp. sativa]
MEKVGDDEFGKMLAEILRLNNVDNYGMRFDHKARTALSFVQDLLSQCGEHLEKGDIHQGPAVLGLAMLVSLAQTGHEISRNVPHSDVDFMNMNPPVMEGLDVLMTVG